MRATAQEIVDTEDKRDAQRYWQAMNRAAVAAVKGAIRGKGGRVLEIGCGTGRLTKWIAPHCEWIAGIDLEPRFSIKAREMSRDQTTFLLADGLDLCFADQAFDAVVAMEVIEHVQDAYSFIKEALRVLKDQGVFFFTTPNRHRLTSRIRALLGRSITFPHCYGVDPIAGEVIHLREYSRRELLDLLKGFPVHSKIKGVYLGVPAWEAGIPHPPSWVDGWSSTWHVQVTKKGSQGSC